MKILLATANMGKLKEFLEIFETANFKDIEIITLKDLPKVEEPIEDGETFLANAYLKAKYYYEKFHLPTISEDSGLCVEALNNAPGIYTARYGSINGEHTDSVKAYTRVLNEMKNETNRKAKFVSAMYYYDDQTLISSIGEFLGEIAYEPSIGGGFGYDPIFYVPKYQVTSSLLPMDVKNSISHRGVATRLLIGQLKKHFEK